jgi:D-alanyl-D-alanine carboxypeptidase
MLAAGNAADPSFNLQPVSCYRSVALQKSLYERQVKRQLQQGMSQERAEEVAATIVKRPGQSEHNTGLAADLGGSGNYSLEQSFEKTAAFKWLYENCADYGFILRFPKNKENITGVIYEPWHYRYVGKEVAKEIMSQGLCLEEYLEKTGQ